MANNKTKLTKSGYKALVEERKHLLEVTLEEIKQQLVEARSQGDLSENADYDAARDRQAETEGRIKQIEDILANSEIIDEKKSTKRVGLGSTVKILNLKTEKEVEYTIVDTVEADPFKNWISQASVLGAAMMGKSVNDIVEVKAINAYQIKILEIKVMSI